MLTFLLTTTVKGSRESLQEVGLTKDCYLGGRLATSLHTGKSMEKLRFVHQAPVERPFTNDSTPSNSRNEVVQSFRGFMGGMRRRPFALL